MKKLLTFCLLMVSIITLSSCGNNQNKGTNKTSDTKTETINTTETNSSITNESSVSNEVAQQAIDAVVVSLQKGLAGTHNVEYDKINKTFKISAIQGIPETTTLQKIANEPTNERYLDTIKGMASNFVNLSIDMKQKLGSGYSIVLLNPTDGGKDIFIVKDGNISYPYAEN